jgi:hypothetical protein
MAQLVGPGLVGALLVERLPKADPAVLLSDATDPRDGEHAGVG